MVKREDPKPEEVRRQRGDWISGPGGPPWRPYTLPAPQLPPQEPSSARYPPYDMAEVVQRRTAAAINDDFPGWVSSYDASGWAAVRRSDGDTVRASSPRGLRAILSVRSDT